jgi:hypothetical protein
MPIQAANQAPVIKVTKPVVAGRPVRVAQGDALVVKGAKDALALSRRYATDSNHDGRIDDSEARAFAKAAKLPVAPTWLDKLLITVGLKSPATMPTTAKLPVGARASSALLAARAAQAHLGAAGADLNWAEAAIAKHGNAQRVTVKGGSATHTLVVTPDGANQFRVATQLEAQAARIDAKLTNAYDREIAKGLVEKLIAVAPSGWAPAMDWGTFSASLGPVDSELVTVKAESGKTYRFYAATGQGEGEIFVGPAQLQDLYFSSGIEDAQALNVGSAMLETLAPHMADGWAPEVDWRTLKLEREAGKVVRASIHEPKGGAAHHFAVKQTGEAEAATFQLRLLGR